MNTLLLPSIGLFVIWLIVLFFSHSTRKEQLIMSFVGLIVTPGALFLTVNNEQLLQTTSSFIIHAEDFLFPFALFGIAAVIYEAVFGRHTRTQSSSAKKQDQTIVHWGLQLILVLLTWIVIALLLMTVFQMTSVRAAIVGGLMIGIYIIAQRHDLLTNALLSSLLVVLLVFTVRQLFATQFINTPSTSQPAFDLLTLGTVQIQELLWVAVVGFTVGPLYEWIRQKTTK